MIQSMAGKVKTGGTMRQRLERSEFVIEFLREVTPAHDPLARTKIIRMNQDLSAILAEESIETIELLGEKYGINPAYLASAALIISNLNPFNMWFDYEMLESMIPTLMKRKLPIDYWFWCACRLGLFSVLGLDCIEMGYDKNPIMLLIERSKCTEFGVQRIKPYFDSLEPGKAIVQYCIDNTKYRFKPDEMRRRAEEYIEIYERLKREIGL